MSVIRVRGTFVLSAVVSAWLAACAASPAKVADKSPGATPPPVAVACRKPEFDCTSQPIKIDLQRKDGSHFKTEVPAPVPIVQYGNISVFPGQTLYIEAELKGDKIASLHLVAQPVHPERTFTIDFDQAYDDDEKPFMALVIKNPFARPVKYHAHMMLLDGPDGALYQTSTCPVVGGGSAFEMWPTPIFQLVLTDIHFLSKGSKQGVCVF